MKVTVVCEYNASMSSPEGVAAYPEGLSVCLKDMFGSFGYETTLITYDDKRHAEELTLDVLQNTDVLCGGDIGTTTPSPTKRRQWWPIR